MGISEVLALGYHSVAGEDSAQGGGQDGPFFLRPGVDQEAEFQVLLRHTPIRWLPVRKAGLTFLSLTS